MKDTFFRDITNEAILDMFLKVRVNDERNSPQEIRDKLSDFN